MTYRLLCTPVLTPLLRLLSRLVLAALGWRVVGRIPKGTKKYVAIVGPHTSNWDFPILLMTAFVLQIDGHWLGKHTLFRHPFRGIMTYLGGIPVDRRGHNDLVASTAALFNSHDEFVVVITPEGTRTVGARWHTGFWHLARRAEVPLYLAFIDYNTRRTGVLGEFRLTDDCERDLRSIKLLYVDCHGKCGRRIRV